MLFRIIQKALKHQLERKLFGTLIKTIRKANLATALSEESFAYLHNHFVWVSQDWFAESYMERYN